MNTCIQTLNDWGENFLSFAWPMLWQSSLLIAVVFVFDALFARRIRAAVRYALWLAVLVKLLLPPTLALPTGAAWWLWPAKPPLTPIINTQVVTFDAPVTLPSASVPQTVPFVPPPPTLSGAGWTMIAVGAMDAALLLWLAFRWSRVAAKVRRAAISYDFEPPQSPGVQKRRTTILPLLGERAGVRESSPQPRHEALCDIGIVKILQEVCQLAGRRRCPRLKLVDDVQSPAVYGLFRPVILLPCALAEKLSARQLRAVLLHEAMHLRRGDVWMNCAQTLLQIAYWWHPLLWLANARIRRLREEAVDDAVMLTLRGDADAYAPTLLEVAKFSFRRPLASLALIGILESRSALRRRIERLVDFRPPRRAGLTILSLCGILAFSAAALPMGQGPAQTAETQPAAQGVDRSNPGFSGSVNTIEVNHNVKVVGGLAKNTDASTKPEPVLIGQGRKAIYQKLKNIHVDTVSFQALPLSETIRWLRRQTQLRDPDKTEINFNFNAEGAAASNPNGVTAQIDPATGLPANPLANWMADATQININLRATNVSLPELLNEICRGSDHPIKYSVEDYGVVFSAKDTNAPQYEMREFRIGTNGVFFANLQKATGLQIDASDTNVSVVLKQLFEKKGLDLSPPKQVYYDYRRARTKGLLFVYATEKDLDVIEHTIQILNSPRADQYGWLNSITDQATDSSVVVGNDISEQTESALSQALVEERKAAHMDLTAPAQEIRSQTSPRPVINVTTKTFISALPTDNYVLKWQPNEVATNMFVGTIWQPNPDISTMHLDQFGPFQHIPLLVLLGKLDSKIGYVPAFDISKELDGKTFIDLPGMTNAMLQEVLDAIVKGANQPIRYDNGGRIIDFSPASQYANSANSSQTSPGPVINPVTGLPVFIPQAPSPVNPSDLETKTFFAGTAAFSAAIREKTGETNALQGFRELIAEAGVDLSPPKNVSIMSERMGAIHVEATTNDLKTIAGIIAGLHCPPPMVHIKARFIEVPKSFLASGANHYIPVEATNWVGVLPNPDFRVLLHEIEQQKGSEEVAEPEVTTICWRRTEMRATITQPFVTNYVVNLHPTNSADNIVPQICQVETGPILDVVPMGLQDGYTLDLQVIPSEVEFLGYADTRGLPKRTAIDSWGAKIELPNVLPLFKVYETTMQNKLYKLYDGQTLVLAPTARQVPPGMSDEKWSARIADYFHKSEKEEDKVLLVFVTATLIDEAGNRLHSDREMRFAQNHVPPQDPSSLNSSSYRLDFPTP